MDSQSPKIDYTIIDDGYVMVHNQEKNKFVFIDPDAVLSKSVEDITLP